MTSSRTPQKILILSELLETLGHIREAGRRIVQCHGYFDIVHPGHIRYLEFARAQGDVLIVSLVGDGQGGAVLQEPYIPQHLRAQNVAALEVVDYVFPCETRATEEILSLVKPDVYVKGSEYEHSDAPDFLAEKAAVERYGGRIIFSSGEMSLGLTEEAGRLLVSRESESHCLNRFCRRYGITDRSIEHSLSRFRDLNVLVVGDIVMDRYVFCDALGIASESPMISLVERHEQQFVGGAAIVARHVAALGAHAFLLGAAGEDDLAKRVLQTLEDEGVESNLLIVRPRTIEKTRYLADDTKLFKVDRATRLPLDSVAERRAAVMLEQQSKLADAVIFCDFGYGMITGSLLTRVLPTLRQNVRIITADVSGGRADMLSFQNIDLLCPTELELRALLNDLESGLSATAWNILDKTQARHLLVTLDKRGMVVFQRRSQQRGTPEWSARLMSEQLPSFADRTVDKLGCGDALLAAATLSLAVGNDLMKTAYIGNAAAAIELALLGNKPVHAGQLRDWLRTRREVTFTPEKKDAAHPLPV